MTQLGRGRWHPVGIIGLVQAAMRMMTIDAWLDSAGADGIPRGSSGSCCHAHDDLDAWRDAARADGIPWDHRTRSGCLRMMTIDAWRDAWLDAGRADGIPWGSADSFKLPAHDDDRRMA